MSSYDVGTDWYMAPQLKNKQKFTNQVDAWAVGLVLMELWMKYRVNNAKFAGGLIPALVESFPTNNQLLQVKDMQLRWIVGKLLIRDPQNRGSVK